LRPNANRARTQGNDIKEGVAVFVIKRDGHNDEIYSSDQVEIQVALDRVTHSNGIVEGGQDQ
jgi:hypothetical protein